MRGQISLIFLPIWLLCLNQSFLKVSASRIPTSFLETNQADEEEFGPALIQQADQSIEDAETDANLLEPSALSNLPNDEPIQEEEQSGRQDLDDFLSQFVLIKTPYGYILARAAPNGEMVRLRRSRQAGNNFQLRVRKDQRQLMNEMFRDRKSDSLPFKAQNNFQLRVRKSMGPQQIADLDATNNFMNTRVRKALLQEIRDRRRVAADHSNNNFQLRVRKSPERSTRGSAPQGKNFQLRVRRSAEW